MTYNRWLLALLPNHHHSFGINIIPSESQSSLPNHACLQKFLKFLSMLTKRPRPGGFAYFYSSRTCLKKMFSINIKILWSCYQFVSSMAIFKLQAGASMDSNVCRLVCLGNVRKKTKNIELKLDVYGEQQSLNFSGYLHSITSTISKYCLDDSIWPR